MNIANKLTFTRIILIPVMAVLYFCGLNRTVSGGGAACSVFLFGKSMVFFSRCCRQLCGACVGAGRNSVQCLFEL